MLKVLVTGVGGGGHGEQIVKSLRMSLHKYQLLGADCNEQAIDPTIFSKKFILPRADDKTYLEKLHEIVTKNQVDVLFHGSEPELLKISENISEFEKLNCFVPVNSIAHVKLCMDKYNLMKILEKKGFNPPRTKMYSPNNNSLSEVDFYPVVVKPSTNSGGSNDVFIAQNENQLKNIIAFLNLEYRHDLHFILQEYVGNKNGEFTVGVLNDSKGNYINSIALRRDLTSQLSVKMRVRNVSQKINEFGEDLVISSGVSQGEINNFQEIRDFSQKIVQSLGLRYSVNLQMRKVDEGYKIFEINPRFSGTTSIRALVGYNEPDVLIRKEVLNEEIKVNFKYDYGIVSRSISERIVSRII